MGLIEEKRAIQMLRGLAAGISIDYRITEKEIDGLDEWLVVHSGLRWRYPFRELAQLVERVRTDGLDDDLQQTILDWCGQLVDDAGVRCHCETEAIRRLHGILHGISMDGVVSLQEMVDLRDWLLDYDAFKECWPFSSVHELVERVLGDNCIDEAEQAEILAFCEQFAVKLPEFDITHDATWRKTLSFSVSSIHSVCEPNPIVRFIGRSFCFTGKAATGLRKDLESAVKTLGGDPVPSTTPSLDYLVIGQLSSPLWAYSTYGRKVENVIKAWGGGSRTLIIKEKDFVNSAKSMKPDVLPSNPEFTE